MSFVPSFVRPATVCARHWSRSPVSAGRPPSTLPRPATDQKSCSLATNRSTSTVFRRITLPSLRIVKTNISNTKNDDMASNTAQKRLPQPAARVAGKGIDVWTFVNESAAQTPKQPVVHMGQGFFGYNPPDFVIKAAQDALNRVECNQYSHTKGRIRLRQAIAKAYEKPLQRSINPETEVVISTGANEGIFAAIAAFVNPGEEVIVFEPFFDQYVPNTEFAAGHVRYVPLHPPKDGAERTSPASGWSVDFDALEKAITPKSRVLIINTPHNPVGKIFTKEELERIGELCIRHNLLIISDEVYDKLSYTPFTHISTLSPELQQRTLVVGSGGKNFYATGWRVGWLIGPPELIYPVAIAHRSVCYTGVSPLQEGLAVALEEADRYGFWEKSRTDMKSKMDRFNAIWKELDIPFSDPDGGYFVMANLRRVQIPSDYPFPPHVAGRTRDFRLCYFLIQEFGVAAIPPTEFYIPEHAHLADDWLRFAICKDDDVLETAKERLRGLKKYLK